MAKLQVNFKDGKTQVVDLSEAEKKQAQCHFEASKTLSPMSPGSRDVANLQFSAMGSVFVFAQIESLSEPTEVKKQKAISFDFGYNKED